MLRIVYPAKSLESILISSSACRHHKLAGNSIPFSGCTVYAAPLIYCVMITISVQRQNKTHIGELFTRIIQETFITIILYIH